MIELLLLAIAFYWLFNKLSNTSGVLSIGKNYKTHPNGTCRPHTWRERTPDESGYLICSQCGKKPGDSSFSTEG